MKLYFDCSSGISADMIFEALTRMGGDGVWAKHVEIPEGDHNVDGHHHRSYKEVKAIIENSLMTDKVRATAYAIYDIIARAEAKVHGTTVEDVHFHEVGRDQAIRNIVGISGAYNSMFINEVYCSAIHDGTGTIQCSHGEIPVPVPAVRAMMEECDYEFVTDEDVKTEMVTPSGLAILMGIGAKYVPEMPEGVLLQDVTIKGKRDTGKPGLRVCLLT
ncbi:MAG: DUF111 family protein [Firmicutes bacterium]|nr:DUF111 family protein [Bacillota bacterium]